MKKSWPPLFILATERSGTNLLRKRITDSQDVYYGPSPTHFLKHLFYSQPFYGDLSVNDNFLKLINDALQLCLVHFSPWIINWTPDKLLDEYTAEYGMRNAVLLSHFLLNKYANQQGYNTYLCKDNYLFDFYMHISHFLPDSKFIYLYRDPRDCTLSHLKRPHSSLSISQIAKMWKNQQLRCLSCLHTLRSDQIFTVSYEDLITSETQIINETLSFLEVSKNDNRKHSATQSPCDDWKNLDLPTITDNYNKYLRYLKKCQIHVIESICWDEMILLGYEPMNTVKPKLASFNLKKFQLLFKGLFSGSFRNANEKLLRNKRSHLLKSFKHIDV